MCFAANSFLLEVEYLPSDVTPTYESVKSQTNVHIIIIKTHRLLSFNSESRLNFFSFVKLLKEL